MNDQVMEFAVIEKDSPAINSSEECEVIKGIPSKKKKPKTKVCRVVNYVRTYGIVGFYFDGVPCQLMVKPGTQIGKTITVKYDGNIKTGIHFWL